MMAKAASRIGIADVAYFVLGALSAPFIITGILRLLPDARPFWFPFVVVLAAGAFAWRASWRALGAGLASGAIAHALFLQWLLNSFSQGLRGL